MMQTDLTILRERIFDAAKASSVGTRVEDVTLESDCDEDGSDFLRVVIRIKEGGQTVDAEFQALLESIENAVGVLDERYPSVRFADAA